MIKTKIKNSKGEPIVLNSREAHVAKYCERQINNALGYEVDITTLTAISKRVTEQKFFTVRPSDYIPVRVGEGAWSTEILTYRTFDVSDSFETGLVNTANGKSRFAESDAGIDSITIPVNNWGKEINWSIFEVQHAQRSGNWDVVVSKERARKRNWDLGIQKVAFLGLENGVEGLLTQGNVTSNTSTITELISGMTALEFSAFVQQVIEDYRSNSKRTAMPTHFIIPEADYNGMMAPVSAEFPNIDKLTYLENAFKRITMNQDFKILPLAYADKSQNAAVTGLNKNRYTLLRYDEDSIRMDIPVDYTNTLQNTVNGAQFTNVGYGQFTGVKAYRPDEVLYFDF